MNPRDVRRLVMQLTGDRDGARFFTAEFSARVCRRRAKEPSIVLPAREQLSLPFDKPPRGGK